MGDRSCQILAHQVEKAAVIVSSDPEDFGYLTQLLGWGLNRPQPSDLSEHWMDYLSQRVIVLRPSASRLPRLQALQAMLDWVSVGHVLVLVPSVCHWLSRRGRAWRTMFGCPCCVEATLVALRNHSNVAALKGSLACRGDNQKSLTVTFPRDLWLASESEQSTLSHRRRLGCAPPFSGQAFNLGEAERWHG